MGKVYNHLQVVHSYSLPPFVVAAIGMRDSASPSNSYKRDESVHSRGRSRSRSRSRSPTPKSYRRRRSRSSSRDYRSRRTSGYSSSYGYRRGQPRDNPVPSRCIGVFGLSLSTTERDLYDLFSRYGEVEDVTIVYDNFTGHSRGFGFVYMRHLSDAKEAKHDAHGTELDGRPIRVDYSVTERPHSPTPGVYMGRPTRRCGARRRTPSPRRRYSRSRSRSYD
ncbi:transformer 2 protein [Echinococcus multilocularis]|uniref:Transformer 2 protein n=1 Tax=Echinococcus multilocularis TaxID=6211 RepID=A0A068Y440_ECHMU|nr:transformer 2 protein [Echinococcus multilocularis]